MKYEKLFLHVLLVSDMYKQRKIRFKTFLFHHILKLINLYV